MAKKPIYYSIDKILEYKAHYNVIVGERSNGKTYAVLKYALERYFKYGEQLAIIRRWDEDFKGVNGARTCFESLVCNGNGENIVEKLSKGKYKGILYYSKAYYLAEEGFDKSGNSVLLKTKEIIAYGFTLASAERYKMASFPRIKNIFLDEFMTREFYIPNEFINFTSIVSTIVRQRKDVKIFMCANTVNKFGCPYIIEMGLKNFKEQEQGTIDLYKYGNSDLRVALEYTGEALRHKKESNVYFAFNNPRLEMIKSGAWEMDNYPHCPYKYRPKDIIFTYFIEYDEQMLQAEIISRDGNFFTFIHRKTTPIQDENKDLIFSSKFDSNPNHRRRITESYDLVGKRIYQFFPMEKVFYQDNEVGEVVSNYLRWCEQSPSVITN